MGQQAMKPSLSLKTEVTGRERPKRDETRVIVRSQRERKKERNTMK